MKKTLYLLQGIVFLLLVPLLARGQQGTITYGFKSNGKQVRQDHPLQLAYRDGVASLSTSRKGQQVRQYIDYNQKAVFKYLSFKDSTYVLKTPFDSLAKATLSRDTVTILGYLCHKAHLVIRSNSIDVWYTDKLPLKGSPALDIAPYLGLVLKVVRNGNFQMYATNVRIGSVSASPALKLPSGQAVDAATFQALLIRSRYTTVNVFTDQKVNFGDSLVNPPGRQLNKVYRFSGGTVVLKKIGLPEHFNGHVFATVHQYSNGDAYDRTGCAFVVPMGGKISFLDALQQGVGVLPVYKDRSGKDYQGIRRTVDYVPPVELVRFFTPFGVGAYNDKVKIKGYHWADSVTYSQDVTDLLPLLKGEAWLGVYIGNYDKKGHTVSLQLNYYPDHDSPDTARKSWVLPLFNTLNIMEMSGQNYGRLFTTDSLKIRAFIPDGIGDLRLRYLSTGHGGWDEGDEFTPKENTLLIDGKKVFSFVPWRSDCATYRLENPSSGNFGDGLSSSDLSRSGWCPGTTTNPLYIPLPRLTSGWHTFTIAIPEGKQQGSSFSFWNVSGCLTGTYKSGK
ncbi:MAG TPA: PNGase F N-terminal domain-containing protein [Chitinophagaceae bacterium]|nr:PNGase F N-terminal domain-containing protein [Chitinophagaceae bacterium]